MEQLRRTPLYGRHVAAGAKIVEFGGWDMPLHYAGGIFEEHLATRKGAGLFDVSHMGRFVLRGSGAAPFLQHALTNNAAALQPGEAQYTMIPDPSGGAVDDAYLYRFVADEWLLVVNAANRGKDWAHFQSLIGAFHDVQLMDRSEEISMISLQGPRSRAIIEGLLERPDLPEPRRNALGSGVIKGRKVLIARTGYTGEPLCFELFVPSGDAVAIWDLLCGAGASPVGLGARDTLRLEAGLPLYGHELGTDIEGKTIPIFACPLARFAVSFSPRKGDFVGKSALARQFESFRLLRQGDPSGSAGLPKMVMPLAVFGKAIARAGAKVLSADGKKHLGWVTSGTPVPYWKTAGGSLDTRLTDEKGMRTVALALVDSTLRMDAAAAVDVRGRLAEARVVPYHLRSEAPPHAWPIVYSAAGETGSPTAVNRGWRPLPATQPVAQPAPASAPDKVSRLLEEAVANTVWRQRECINLIPSEMTTSPMVRLLSAMDPAFRYAEHKAVKAFDDAEVFYYQGTDFVHRAEELLEDEFRKFLGCSRVETRVLSGQMANAVVFSAMVDYINRANRREEPRRLRCVLNHGIIRGGHLSSQPMGALRDFVARDAATEMPAAVNFPVRAEDPFQIDVEACREVLQRHRPELIIFGKSLVLYPEPVAEVRGMVEKLGLGSIVMYDMAHVLGLAGPRFQQPFRDGADIVTGSTHKTFFGAQRGVVAANFPDGDMREELWDAIRRRTFPGAVSNHHLGTLVGLLMAAYEMNHFRDEYQPAVLANSRAFARALAGRGLEVAGDPAGGYTRTHQVLLHVGYGRGPEMARRLEEANLVVNYQAGPSEEGFTAAGYIRMGVSEMTRFGMREADFGEVAQLIADALAGKPGVADAVKKLRQRFLDMRFCFGGKQYEAAMQKMHSLIG
jgi:aminomethyltransferase